MGKGRITGPSACDSQKARRTSPARVANDHLERRQGLRSSRLVSGERTRLGQSHDMGNSLIS